ncbi:MAG TPA: trehalose-6-phosphate synthase [Candidatus Dormibacteraeota bacterium]|nr:trehalose-6-phosphate synthase [Candidatus Dormibacteraeota bacterium]
MSQRNPDTMHQYMARVLAPWSPIVVANRAPYDPGPRGSMRKGAGGVVTALLGLVEATGADWVACARTPAERERAGSGAAVEIQGPERPVQLHYVVPEPDAYRRYYSVISNPLLWFLHHYLWDIAYEPLIDDGYWRAWYEGYVKVNHLMAEKVAEVASRLPRPPLVLTQDYQLYLAPPAIRKLVPEATLQQFIHVPWPTPNYWKVIPAEMREGIVEGLLANDVIGFHTTLDVRNFLLCCEELLGLRVDHRERAVLSGGRAVWVRPYPVSIDVESLQRQAQAPAVRAELEALRQQRPEKLIVRVDRTDPSKNVIRGFLAYERMLRAHPDLQGRVQFYAFLQPSRQDVTAYRRYLDTIKRTVHRINSSLGRRGWLPIRLELGENMRRALALYREFDVLLVNPIYDGMNLVAKEGMTVNERDGALVLSENAGAHEELGEHAFSINPFDVDNTGDSLYSALTASVGRRRQNAQAIRRTVRSNDIGRWISSQIRDLRDLAPPPTRPDD